MSTLPSWAQCSIIAALVLLSPAIAFLMALAVAIAVGLLKEAGAPAALVSPPVPQSTCCFGGCAARPVGHRLPGDCPYSPTNSEPILIKPCSGFEKANRPWRRAGLN
jgi:hypothetical protein